MSNAFQRVERDLFTGAEPQGFDAFLQTLLQIGSDLADAQAILQTTTLDGALDDETTTVVVTDATYMPARDFPLLVESERMYVTSRSGNSLTVIRQSPVAHLTGVGVTVPDTFSNSAAEVLHRLAGTNGHILGALAQRLHTLQSGYDRA